MSTVVFLGPSASPASITEVLEDAVIAPPVHRGDVLRTAQQGATTLLIIDGYFDTTPAVWHKELLYALSLGIRVYGAASMGALRAAEMAPFGMVGVGEVFDELCMGLLDDDDVVVVHDHHSDGAKSRSVAMVNIRWTLRAAASEGVIANNVAEDLDALAKATFYPERTYSGLLRDGQRSGLLDADHVERLTAWLPLHAIDIKAQDAVMGARRVVADRATGVIRSDPPRFVRTSYFDAFLSEEAERHDDVVDNWTRSVIDELRASPRRYQEVRDLAKQRRAWIEVANQAGVRPDQRATAQAWEDLRHEQRLFDPAEVDAWLDGADLNTAGYGDFIEREAKARWGRQRLGPPGLDDIIDVLRSQGEYSALVKRTRKRADALRASGRSETGDATGPGTSLVDARRAFARHAGVDLDQCDDDTLCELLDFPSKRALHEFLAVFGATEAM